MLNTFVIVSAAAGMAAGQSSMGSSLFMPAYAFEGSQTMVASIITAAPTGAEFYVTCAPNEDGCGLGPGATVTMQPGTYGIGINEPDFTLSHRCELEQQTAICTLMADGSEANDPGTATETMTDITTADFFRLVTITAGFEALAAATGGGEGAAAKPTSAPTQSGDADDSTITAPPTAGTASSDSAADSAEETSPSTAAAPRATRDAVAAGFAVLMGCALAL